MSGLAPSDHKFESKAAELRQLQGQKGRAGSRQIVRQMDRQGRSRSVGTNATSVQVVCFSVESAEGSYTLALVCCI